ncbi:MAG: hypothetical protein K0R46_1969 [Herbinix sp.]|jgi:hypothetical protein|nr:hypothetical protein [Herbinix sp.]
MGERAVMEWLMEGDIAIRYQVMRDLLQVSQQQLEDVQKAIAENGWGRQLLDMRNKETGIWGNGLYSPKWISTHYTLLQLKDFGFPGTHPDFVASSRVLLNGMWHNRGEVKRNYYVDLCVAAMILGICSYALITSEKLEEIVDYILAKQYDDGGWNCNWPREDSKSSLHTTLTVLEAFRDYEAYGYTYRLEEIKGSVPKAEEFILRKRLFRSERTGEIIHEKMLTMSYPCRWKYDFLRCLDYFQSVGRSYDSRMEEALKIMISKKKANNRWNVPSRISGLVYFDMEKAGLPSRWNTLRVLRVMKLYLPEEYELLVSSI